MPSFGEKLKREREKRAITLEQISASTKIGTRMLQALEEEKFDQLPGGIFNKGFVRAYARHLGIDEEQTIADYLEASGEGPAAKAAAAIEAETPPAESREISRRQPPWALLASLLLLVALALYLWSRWKHNNEAHSSPSPAISQQPLTSPATGAAAGSAPSLAPSAPAVTTSPPAKGASPSPKPPSVSGRSVVEAAEIAPAPPAPGGFTVVILAREDSWLSITADGKNIFADTLVAENQHAVHAQKQVVVKAGNTGALDFVFNGKKLASQGDYGEVKTLTFGSSGLQPNAPAPPTTP